MRRKKQKTMKPSSKSHAPLPRPAQRLQKVLAAAGLGSRRQCEELILAGRVEIDRQVVTTLGTQVDTSQQRIRVDGVPLKQPRRLYFAVNKPPGVVSTSKDQWQRLRVVDLIDSEQRLFSIGRLDKESSGLILVTNDGELANRLTHPRYGVAKTYHVTVAGLPSRDVIQRLRRGFHLAEGPARPQSVRVKKRLKQSTLLEIILAEGRNREIRRMLARVGHKVLQLHRVAIGPVRLGMLPRGASRELTKDEVRMLKRLDPVTRSSAQRKSLPRGGRPAANKPRRVTEGSPEKRVTRPGGRAAPGTACATRKKAPRRRDG